MSVCALENSHGCHFLRLDTHCVVLLLNIIKTERKTDVMSFSSSLNCSKTRPNIPLGLICLSNTCISS